MIKVAVIIIAMVVAFCVLCIAGEATKVTIQEWGQERSGDVASVAILAALFVQVALDVAIMVAVASS